MIKFTLENYLKCSFGHGVTSEEELKQLASDLNQEIELRKHYRNALAQLYATIKASQLELRTKTDTNGLPAFKQLLGLQNSINELEDYIKLLSSDILEYSNCLSKLEENNLVIDDTHELFIPEDFGIELLTEESSDGTSKQQQK